MLKCKATGDTFKKFINCRSSFAGTGDKKSDAVASTSDFEVICNKSRNDKESSCISGTSY